MKVELLKTKQIYKGKEFYDFYIKLDNGMILSINVNALYSDKVTKQTKFRIINDLKLVGTDYVKEQKDTQIVQHKLYQKHFSITLNHHR